jgi:uncharacterized membrane protein
MVHLYRGEVSRANVWRRRLDITTNWAVVTTAAILTFAFGSSTNSHVVILLGMLLVWLFLITESRRYKYYELWALRVRLMETDFFAAMLHPPFRPHSEWAGRLVDSLLTPKFPISTREAIGRRLRRQYVWLFLLLGGAWLAKVMIHPVPARSLDNFFKNASLDIIPGTVIVALVVILLGFVFIVALSTITLQDSPGEVLPHYQALSLSSDFLHNLATAAGQALPDEFLFGSHEQLAIIITDEAEDVSQQLLSILKRGITALEGKGMYSGARRDVLLCAVPASEIQRLKSIVHAVDDRAFVVVNPTEEVLGSTFGSLAPRWRQSPKKPPVD